MRITTLAAASLTLASTLALAQTGKPASLVLHTFEENDGGWTAMGPSGKVSVTHDPTAVHEGKSALRFDYTLQKAELSALILPVGDGAVARAKSLRFWVKADSNAMLGVFLQEQDGGRYAAMFTVPKDKWQQVELAASDFVLSEDTNDPKDPDNKLDLDKVGQIGIIDVAQVFVQSDNEQLLQLFNLKRGPHTLYLDDFAVTEDVVAPAFTAGEAAVRFDTFAHAQAGWFVVGDVRLTPASSGPIQGRSLQAAYTYGPAKFVGMMRRIPRGRLEGMQKISFEVASAKAIRLMVQVEEKDGGKYNTIADVPAGKAIRSFSIPFKELIAADDSHDSNNKLDLDQINQIVFVDITAAAGGATEADNTLWIGSLKAEK